MEHNLREEDTLSIKDKTSEFILSPLFGDSTVCVARVCMIVFGQQLGEVSTHESWWWKVELLFTKSAYGPA